MKIHLPLLFLLFTLPASACQNPNPAAQRSEPQHFDARGPQDPQNMPHPRDGRGPRGMQAPRDGHGRRGGWRARERQGPAFCPHCGHKLRRFQPPERGPRTNPEFQRQRGPGNRPGRRVAPQQPQVERN